VQTKKNVLFITDENYVNQEIPGGVQLCTDEFLQYIRSAGFNPVIFAVKPTRSISKRFRARAGINVYDLYDFENYANAVAGVVSGNEIDLIFLNQLNLCPLIRLLKPLLPLSTKFVGLSHGNESGDYLHEINKFRRPGFLETWRLGSMLNSERDFFTNLLDGTVVISSNEKFIDQWLGASHVLYMPRILRPSFLEVRNILKRVGFVGTLDHLPNSTGLKELCRQLKSADFDGELRLIGSSGQTSSYLTSRYSFVNYLGRLSNAELEIEVSTWSVFLNPVFWYSRGSSTKLAQALNWGLPVISTPAGARGYDLSEMSIITSDDSKEQFAEVLLSLYNSPNRIQDNITAVRKNVERFNFTQWTEQLKTFLANLRHTGHEAL
jgi:glycosyltransferase involved in cell wall biosynthesis